MKRYYDIEFTDKKEVGIRIFALNRKEAIKKAENPMNWKDGKARKVSYCKAILK